MDLVCAAVGLSSTSDDMPPAPVRIIACRRARWRSRSRRREYVDHRARWAAQMLRDAADLWAFVVELDHDSRMALFAHCVALTVNALRLPSERRPRATVTADRLAEAVSLDMTAHWTPTVRTYLGH